MSRYADAHSQERLHGPGDGRPTAMQIVEDEGRLNTMKDKVFVITGCSSGIGIETARALAATGARLFLLVRSLHKGRAACAGFLDLGRVDLVECDTSSLASVRAAAAAILAAAPALHLLICNAGIMQLPRREVSADGFECQLATNYLGHFLLFWLLKEALLRGGDGGGTSGGEGVAAARLVNVSSSGHHATEMRFDDINLAAEGAYDPLVAYGQSKLAQIYMANAVDRIYGARGLRALSVMPGGILSGLMQHLDQTRVEAWKADEKAMRWMKSPAQGAATTVMAAVGREWEARGGVYLEDCRLATREPLVHTLVGVKDYAYDEAKEERLWRLTLDILGLKEDEGIA
ncbi:putative oxidoreductase,short chain dehydrogenase [Xylariales sp. PMI_506]|nr:putative oxidoreductase,short chain dehydrogenase [Xylariales sp. PMI_506]